jgi:hypothetical protein
MRIGTPFASTIRVLHLGVFGFFTAPTTDWMCRGSFSEFGTRMGDVRFSTATSAAAADDDVAAVGFILLRLGERERLRWRRSPVGFLSERTWRSRSRSLADEETCLSGTGVPLRVDTSLRGGEYCREL